MSKTLRRIRNVHQRASSAVSDAANWPILWGVECLRTFEWGGGRHRFTAFMDELLRLVDLYGGYRFNLDCNEKKLTYSHEEAQSILRDLCVCVELANDTLDSREELQRLPQEIRRACYVTGKAAIFVAGEYCTVSKRRDVSISDSLWREGQRLNYQQRSARSKT